jgi:endoglucanase
MEPLSLLRSLCGAFGVSGCEQEAATVAAGHLASLGPVHTTALGSLVCRLRPLRPDRPHVLLTAHMDQIGLVVTRVCEGGFVRFAPIGGIDRRALSAARVLIRAADGDIPGVVTSTPPHLQTDDARKPPKAEDLCIDTGLSDERCRERIAPGDRICFRGGLTPLAGTRVCAPALDNRAGCAAVMLAAARLMENPPDAGLSLMLSTQEETGSAGGETAAFSLSPTHVLAVDTSMALTPDDRPERCGLMGAGPMIGVAPILDRGMFEELKACARALELPFQIEAMGGRTGTDADHIAVARGGAKTALLSIPLRYMHTPSEIIDFTDLENSVRLIEEYVRWMSA